MPGDYQCLFVGYCHIFARAHSRYRRSQSHACSQAVNDQVGIGIDSQFLQARVAFEHFNTQWGETRLHLFCPLGNANALGAPVLGLFTQQLGIASGA